MKNFNILTLSMLLLTAGITIQANIHSDNFDERNHLDKHRNSNRYDGTTITTADEHDKYDTEHHLNKHRESHQGSHCHRCNKNNEKQENQYVMKNEIKQEEQFDNQSDFSSEKMMPAQTTRTWAEYFRSLM